MNFRNVLMWGLIILLSVGLFNLFQNPDRANLNSNQIAFSKFLEEVAIAIVFANETCPASSINK